MKYRIHLIDLGEYEIYDYAEDYVNRLLEFREYGHKLCFTMVDKTGLYTCVELRREVHENEI